MLTVMQNLKRRYYGQHVDRAERFNRLVELYLDKDRDVLHAGCGSDGSIKFKAKARRVIGIDLDAWVAGNDEVDFPILGDLQRLPLPDACVDLVVSRWVVEHLETPAQAFAETSRVLKPNGLFILMTNNLLHYAVLATKLTPHRLHKWFMEVILEMESDEVFPTYLRANTLRKLRWLGAQTGLVEEHVEMFEGAPMYLAFSLPAFLLGVAYERMVNRFGMLAWLRSVIIGVYRKTD